MSERFVFYKRRITLCGRYNPNTRDIVINLPGSHREALLAYSFSQFDSRSFSTYHDWLVNLLTEVITHEHIHDVCRHKILIPSGIVDRLDFPVLYDICKPQRSVCNE